MSPKRQAPPGEAQAPAVQRVRLRYQRLEPVRYLSHLDLMRMFERALRRARLPVAHTAGFTPHPRISIAAPLGVGLLSECELIDIFFEQVSPLEEVEARLRAQLPSGFDVVSVVDVPLHDPPLQTLTEAVRYRIEWLTAASDIPDRLSGIESAETLPVMRERNDERIYFDLKPLLRGVRLVQEAPPVVEVLLRQDNETAGRPEDLLYALDVDPLDTRITRTEILLAGAPVKPGNPVPRRVEKLPRGTVERDRILRYPETAQ
jgi:radical SAM-linked protein